MIYGYGAGERVNAPPYHAIDLDFYVQSEVRWWADWRLDRALYELWRIEIPTFKLGMKWDFVLHKQEMAICINPGIYLQPFNFRI